MQSQGQHQESLKETFSRYIALAFISTVGVLIQNLINCNIIYNKTNKRQILHSKPFHHSFPQIPFNTFFKNNMAILNRKKRLFQRTKMMLVVYLFVFLFIIWYLSLIIVEFLITDLLHSVGSVHSSITYLSAQPIQYFVPVLDTHRGMYI